MPKGDFRPAVQLAAIAAAKRTAELIPLCHPLPLDHVDVQVETDSAAGRVRVCATATVTGRTGVEMEALTAVSVGLLTAYDLLKAVERGIALEEKSENCDLMGIDLIWDHQCLPFQILFRNFFKNMGKTLKII